VFVGGQSVLGLRVCWLGTECECSVGREERRKKFYCCCFWLWLMLLFFFFFCFF